MSGITIITEMMKSKSIKIQFIFLILSTLLFTPVQAFELTKGAVSLADFFNSYIDDNAGSTSFPSLNIPSGGRSESLGSAYTAICDDINFFDYNPAASAVLENTEIAVSHNAWIADSALETVAASIRDENFGMGAQLKCFYVPFTEYNAYGERVAGSYYSETSITFNASYNFLAGYNFKGIALGANVKGAWRNIGDYTDNQTDEIIEGSGLAQSALAGMVDLGLLVRFNVAKNFSNREPNLNFGLVIKNLGAAITGFGSDQGVIRDDSLPTAVSLGLAWRPVRAILVSTDFSQPINLFDFGSSEKWSWGLGVEARVTPFFNVLSGFLLKGGNPRISFGSGFSMKKAFININYSFDLTSSLNPVNHISLAAKLSLGDRGRKARQKLVDSHYVQGLLYYAEGSRENIERAIEEWDSCLRIDKRFDPAIEAKKAAEELLAAHDAIIEYGTLKSGK